MLCIKMDKFFVDSMYQTSCHISRIDLPKYYLRLFLSVVFFFVVVGVRTPDLSLPKCHLII